MNKIVSTRRVFLQKGLTLLAVAPTIPAFLDQTVMALSDAQDVKRTQQPSGKDGKILVVVQLGGGNDGLNTVVPYADDQYHRLRPTLGKEPKAVLKIDNYIGLHENLAPLKKIFDDGQLAVIQGVGYPNPNRSHFRSMDIWQSAQPDRDVAETGWIGRYFDNTCPGTDPNVGVSIGESLPLAMQGDRILPLSFDRPDNYRYKGRDVDDYLKLNKATEAANITRAEVSADRLLRRPERDIPTPQSQLDFLHRTAMDAQISSNDILRFTRQYNGAEYPANDFGNGLRMVAAMIGGQLPTRVYYVTLGGFDTHAAETARHDQLMTQLSAGLAAFWGDMKRQGNQDRVMMMTFSEFGRRVAQNASNGTDHGTAAPMFVIGGNVKQGVIGNHPSLTDLDQGDLKYHIDFRSVYASILQDWLGTASKPILGSQFNTLSIVRT
jgi:uncharacterized protein (DUF1501 family)